MSLLVSSSIAPPPHFSLLPWLIYHSPLPKPPLHTCTHTARWNQRGRGADRACREHIVNPCREAPAGARQCPENSLRPPRLAFRSSSSTALSGEGRRKSTHKNLHLPPPHLSPLLCPPQLPPFSPQLLPSHITAPWLRSVGLLPPPCHSLSSVEHHQPYLLITRPWQSLLCITLKCPSVGLET